MCVRCVAREQEIKTKNLTISNPLSRHELASSLGMSTADDSTLGWTGGRLSAESVTPSRLGEKMKNAEQGGKKYDQGKPRISILQGLAIEQVMLVGEMGAKKYGDHNYRKGMAITRYLNAAFRHAFIEYLFKRQDFDKESGLSHLAHAAWNLLSALEQSLNKPELDDRYKE